MNHPCTKCGTIRDAAALNGLCPRCLALDFLTPTDFNAGSTGNDDLDTLVESTRSFGGFELLEELGRGGMGVVFRSRQRSLNREVALKFLLHGVLAGDVAIARFREEAETAASLRHPNIVSILEVGEVSGRLYLAMELVHGRTLSEILRDGALSAPRAGNYLLRVARALYFAHERGVLHRDLKPGNVLIDEFDQPRVTDFGLAKRVGSGQELTLTGQVLGTPAYISPEQADASEAVDARSDVYSMGALLYHLVTGRPPFVGESPTHVLRQVAETEPIAPRLLNPSLPRDLETICLRCLEKEPARRYASAKVLAEDLERFLNDEPIQARPISPAERAWRWCKRKPALAASLAAIASLLVGIALVSNSAAHRIEVLRLEGLTNLYASDMRLAQQSIAEGKFGTAAELLGRHQPKHGDPDLRGFEWRHFWDLSRGNEAATLGQHSGQAQRALFSHDGRLIATASTDVRLWKTSTRTLQATFSCEDFIRALAFSPDDQYLAAAEGQGGLRCFNLGDHREVANRNDHGPSPFALQWSANDSAVELWSAGNRATWDWSKGTSTNHTPLPVGSNRDVVSENGVLVSLHHPPWRLTAWQSNEMIAAFPLDASALAIAVSRNGKRVALGEFSGTLHTFPLGANGPTNKFPAHRGLINALAFSHDGERVASGGADQVIRFWNATTGQPLNELRGHRRPIWSLAFSPDGEWLVSGDSEGVVKLWSTKTKRSDSLLSATGRSFLASDGSAWVISDPKSQRWFRVKLEDEIGQELPAELSRTCKVLAVAANRLLLAKTNGSLHLLEADGSIANLTLPASLTPGATWISPNGRYIAYETPGLKTHSVWDIAAGRLAWERSSEPARSRILAISGDSKVVAAGDDSGRLQLLDLATGHEIRTIHAHVNTVYAADCSPDGRQVVTVGHDGVAKLWEIETGRLLGEFRSTVESFWNVALAPDGRRIAAGTAESSIVIWDVASRLELATLRLGGSPQPVEGTLRFTPDGTVLLLSGPSPHRWIAPLLKDR